MVASRQTKKVYGPPKFEECRSLEEVWSGFESNEDLVNILPLMRLRKERKDFDEVNVAIGKVSVGVHVTGCIPEHEHYFNRDEERVMDCPSDQAQRCSSCILSLVDGEEILTKIRPYQMSRTGRILWGLTD